MAFSTTAASVVSVSTPADSSLSTAGDQVDSTVIYHEQLPISNSQKDGSSTSQTPQHMNADLVLPSPAASSVNTNTPSRITSRGSVTAETPMMGEINALLQMNSDPNVSAGHHSLQSNRHFDPKMVQFTPETRASGGNKNIKFFTTQEGTNNNTRINKSQNDNIRHKSSQGKSPSSTADSKPIISHITSESSPFILTPKVQKMTTGVVSKIDNDALHEKDCQEVDSNNDPITPKKYSSHNSLGDGMFLSPFFHSPESKLGSTAVTSSHGSKNNPGNAASLHATSSNDFEKNDLSSDSATFDGQYILPWLSPSANGMFLLPSGDISSITPSKSTNQTPKISKLISATSLENHDSSLTLPFEKMTSRNNTNICISPLTRRITALTKEKELGSETPINFNEVFASPKPENNQYRPKHHEIPDILYSSSSTGEETPLRKSLAEQRTREDEDLNVLLKLAETTPRGTENIGVTKANARVFRGKGFTFPAPLGGRIGPPPSSLHLPFIGSEYHANNVSNANGPYHSSNNMKNYSGPTKKRKLMGGTSKLNPQDSGKNHLGPSSISMAPAAYRKDLHPMYPPPTYTPPGLASKRPSSAKKMKSSLARVQTSLNASVNVSTTVVDNKPITQKKALPNTPSRKVTSGKNNPETPKSTGKGRGPGKKKNKPKTPSPLKGEDAELPRGVTQRPSGKWQAQMYFAGKSRYIGVFDTREKAATAYEIARDHLKNKTFKDTDAQVNAARKAAFAGVNEEYPHE